MKEQYWFFPLFFFCDFNIITKTSCGNTKDRNSFKRMLTSLFIRLYKNNPSHRIFKKKKRLKLIKIDRASFKIFPRNQSRNQSITRIRHYSFSHKSLSNNSKIISIITSKYNKKKIYIIHTAYKKNLHLDERKEGKKNLFSLRKNPIPVYL